MTSLDRSFDVPSHVAASELDGEIVILDLDSGLYFGLDPVGASIWQHIADGASLRVAHAALLAEFDVDATVLQGDILDLVADLESAKLIEVRA